jgi:uncharacterized protein YbjT (DUF2867 family)
MSGDAGKQPIVVLGARGQTGKRIVEQLKAKGQNVIAVARGATDGEKIDGVTWYKGDVQDEATMDKVRLAIYV